MGAPAAPRVYGRGDRMSLNQGDSPETAGAVVAPAGDRTVRSFEETSPAAAAAPPIRMLLIESSSLFREGLRALLSTQSDLEIVAEASVESMVVAAAAHRPDIILFESGTLSFAITALQRLREGRVPGRVILITLPDTVETLALAIRYGVAGILPRSSPSEVLLKSIRKVNAGEFWLNRALTAAIIRQLAGEPAPLPRGFSGADQVSLLSRREGEIVTLVSQGYRNREISESLCINQQTVKNHLHNIFEKTGVRDRLELALYAIYHRHHETPGKFTPPH